MADDETTTPAPPADVPDTPAKKTAAKRAPAKKAAAKRAPAKKAAATPPEATLLDAPNDGPDDGPADVPAKKTAKKAPAKKAAAKKTAAKKAPAADADAGAQQPAEQPAAEQAVDSGSPMVLFKAPETTVTTRTRGRRAVAKPAAEPEATPEVTEDDEATTEAPAARAPRRRTPAKKAAAAPSGDDESPQSESPDNTDSSDGSDRDESDEDRDGEGGPRRRRRRGGRRRRKPGDSDDSGSTGSSDDNDKSSDSASSAKDDDGDGSEEGGTRRRRRRRREGDDGGSGSNGGGNGDDPSNTVTRVRRPRSAEDEITSIQGSTRLEAKKQRRREGREAGRRRAPIVSEAEFLARRESVDRVMVIRQREELTQIGVLEDKVLVEHYVARESQTSLIGNVYLGRVQNVLPSMEAAFIDIGKGRNAVLYAGEVNWSSLGHKEGQPRKIESVLSSGQTVLVQVTKDPIGHKGARLTSQVSLAGRFLVYVPDGTTSGISRKLPDTERNRLKNLLREIVPDTAGVIVRTAAEGASEEELTRDVERLKARWEDIESKAKGNAPQLLYGEPDLMLKVVRDLFTEDFTRLVIQGDDAWDTVGAYIEHVAPDLAPRLERYERPASGADVFAAYRLDEQIAKGLDRKVWLPSGGSLVIDRTEAMTVVDVNTGKFTGSGGNLEETVTKNNLEAAEEIVRQLRLRDIGGIIVIDFIDMVLESNRDLVLRRLVECLGRDRTRHQVAEVTSLGLVQMTRKRIGTGLLEAFSQQCDHCGGRGLIVLDAPAEPRRGDEEPRRARRGRTGRGRGEDAAEIAAPKPVPSPAVIAAAARHEVVAPEEVAPEEVAPEEVAPEDLAPEVAAEAEAETSPEAENARPEPQPEPAPEPEPEPEPEPAEPVAPKVVTRTRRRAASRPAGPPPAPVQGDDGAALAGGVSGGIGVPSVTGLVEPGTADLEPGGAEAAHVEHVPIKKKGSRKR